jgi:4-hydroxy-4-methyl-2-oxoglutarate aldolase
MRRQCIHPRFPRHLQLRGVVNAELTKAAFERLRKLDTCVVSNAIERFNVRLRNEGQVSGDAIHCVFPHLPPVLGFAVTARMKSTMEPTTGRAYYENMNWWHYMESLPKPRIMVVEDTDDYPGAGALFGEIHSVICQALDCVAYITNGSVRDLAGVEANGFQLFAGGVAVSHHYAHISEYGKPVEIGGLTISPGDLLHGDRHGVHVIPMQIAAEIPDVADELLREEEELKELCRSPRFSVRRLEAKLHNQSRHEIVTPLDGF